MKPRLTIVHMPEPEHRRQKAVWAACILAVCALVVGLALLALG